MWCNLVIIVLMSVGLCGSWLSHISFPLLPILASQGQLSAPKLFLLCYHFPAYSVFLHFSHMHLANLWPTSSAEALRDSLNCMRQGGKRDCFLVVQCLTSLHTFLFCSHLLPFMLWILISQQSKPQWSTYWHLSHEKCAGLRNKEWERELKWKITLSMPVCK